MATFQQLAGIAQSAVFQQRVQYAASVAAVNVAAEDVATAGHAVRKSYATRVLSNSFSLLGVCFGVLTNPTIAAEANVPDGAAVPDGDIQFAVNSIWNALAGA